MKKAIFALAVAALALVNSLAAEGAKWLTDLDEAKKVAKAENKMIVAEFTGSDWCPACIQLKKEVLSQPEFAKWAEKVVLLEVDFPKKKKLSKKQTKANDALVEKYDMNLFPTMAILDADGKKIDQLEGYEGEGTEKYLKKLDGLLAKKAK